jgi:hypothetical protein
VAFSGLESLRLGPLWRDRDDPATSPTSGVLGRTHIMERGQASNSPRQIGASWCPRTRTTNPPLSYSPAFARNGR